MKHIVLSRRFIDKVWGRRYKLPDNALAIATVRVQIEAILNDLYGTLSGDIEEVIPDLLAGAGWRETCERLDWPMVQQGRIAHARRGAFAVLSVALKPITPMLVDVMSLPVEVKSYTWNEVEQLLDLRQHKLSVEMVYLRRRASQTDIGPDARAILSKYTARSPLLVDYLLLDGEDCLQYRLATLGEIGLTAATVKVVKALAKGRDLGMTRGGVSYSINHVLRQLGVESGHTYLRSIWRQPDVLATRAWWCGVPLKDVELAAPRAHFREIEKQVNEIVAQL